MGLAALALAAGAALLQFQAALPALGASIVVPVLALLALRWRLWWLPAAFAAGFFWAAACAQWRMNDWLPSELEGTDIAVVGYFATGLLWRGYVIRAWRRRATRRRSGGGGATRP